MRYILIAFAFLLSVSFSNSSSHQQEVTRQNKDYALFFAVADYDHGTLPDLPNAITDAEKIAEVLSKNYQFQTEILKNPTLNEVDDKLHEYYQKFNDNTFDNKGQLLIFFSGHGVKDYDNGYFLPADANPDRLIRSAFAYDIWRPYISTMNVQHILVAVDACYSVTFDPTWQSRTNPQFKRIGELSEADRILVNHNSYKNRIFYTADAKENVVPGRSNFARKLYEGLLYYRDKDIPFVTSSELYGTFISKARPAPRAGHFEADQAASSFLFFPVRQRVDKDSYNRREADMAAFEEIQAAPSIAKCEAYLKQFPAGGFRREVYHIQLGLQEDQDWRFAQLKQDGSSYLKKYPEGRYAAAAKKMLPKSRPPSSTSGTENPSTSTPAKETTVASDDITPLFDEINAYIAKGDLYNSKLESLLKEAIVLEPNNPGLYATLASVYKETNRVQDAIDKYNACLAIDELNFNCNYGRGEMYYNEAAVISSKMQDLGFSKADVNEYERLNKIMIQDFEAALPHFQKCEIANPNDNNTLVALSEIYARKNDFEKSNEFRNRLQKVNAGQTNTSYFKSR
ncbi:MAG: caspase family protein [Bacteroidota bacterium]